MEIREEVQWFAEQMEERLRENDHKGGWGCSSPGWLLARAQQELGECAVEFISPGGLDTMIEEAADAANFLMMFARRTGGFR